MRKLFAALFSLALVAGLAACGDDGDDGGSATTTTDTTAEAPATDETTDGTEPTDDTTDPDEDAPSGADRQDYVDAIAANLSSGDEDSGEFVVSDQDAPCVAEGWVDIVGVDTLVDAGVDPEELADSSSNFDSTGLQLEAAQGREMIEVAEDCGVDLLDQFRTFISEGLEPAEAECLNDELDDDTLTGIIAEALVNEEPSDDLEAEFRRLDEACQLS